MIELKPGLAPSESRHPAQPEPPRSLPVQGHAMSLHRPTASIGLCMIVKNEAKVIERCLRSVRPLIDYVLVEDTGSTDGTQEIVRRWLEREDVPGRVVEEAWRDFAYNRSHALEELRRASDVDYAFIMDADDQLVLDPAFDASAFKESLELDEYRVELRQQSIAYRRTQICSNRKRYLFKGVLHEYLECVDKPSSSGFAAGFHIISAREGARSQDPHKYAKDAALLEQVLMGETDEFMVSRYTFYLAQSYRDAREPELALKNYLARSGLRFWSAERFYSLYQAGKIMEQLGRDPEEVLAAYEEAYSLQPSRAESLHAAAALCRRLGLFERGLEYALRGLRVDRPECCLFVEAWVYDHGLFDELAVNAYWCGEYALCVAACERLLREDNMRTGQLARVRQNLAFGLAKLSEGKSPGEQALALARAAERMRESDAVVAGHYSAAADLLPDDERVLAEAARCLRLHGDFGRAHELASRGLAGIAPKRGSPTAVDAMTHRSLLDELAVSAYWLREYQECAEACETLLVDPDLSQNDRERIRKNKDFAESKLKIEFGRQH